MLSSMLDNIAYMILLLLCDCIQINWIYQFIKIKLTFYRVFMMIVKFLSLKLLLLFLF